MTRTFIALEMHASMQRVLSRTIERFAQALPSLHWVDAASIHLTLAFLGELDDDRLALAMEATRAAAHDFPAFEYRLTTPGVFGSPQQPRVIWMGVEDAPLAQLHGLPLQRLHRTLDRELERRNFETEKRPFSPHLTLARVKKPLTPAEQQVLQRLLYTTSDTATLPFYKVNHLNVMKSELSRAGAKYSVLQAYELMVQ
ncbi:MAG: RNA 2',3'-cyclic phosphodiesterase [Ktedonobacteraceae bacterium]